MGELSDAEVDALERLAANTRYWRLRRGLTQAELAEAAGVQTQAVQVVEAAARRPGLKLVFAIAAVLDLDISQLWHRRKKSARRPGRPSRGG